MLFKKIKIKILRIGLNLLVYGFLGVILVFIIPYLAILGLVSGVVMCVGFQLVVVGVIINIVNHFSAKKRETSMEEESNMENSPYTQE